MESFWSLEPTLQGSGAWKPAACVAPVLTYGRGGYACPRKVGQLFSVGQEPHPSSLLRTSTKALELGSLTFGLGWDLSTRKTEMPVELNYVMERGRKTERAVKGREGGGKRGGEREKQ